MLRKIRACSAAITPRSCHAVDALGDGGLRRSRAVRASVGGLWSREGIALGAGWPWIEKIGSLESCVDVDFTRSTTLLAVPIASKQAVVL